MNVLLPVLVTIAIGQSHIVKVDDRTEAKITVQKESVKISWVCNESNMAHVKSYYHKKNRWNLFVGENVDLWFTPHAYKSHKVVYPPNYRVMSNPSGTFFSAFLGVSRPCKNFLHEVKLNEKNWTVEWEIPYAALESGTFNKPAVSKTYYPREFWSFQFNRRSESGGKATYVKSPVVVIELPKGIITPYQQIMFFNYTAKNGVKAGETVVDFKLKNRFKEPFNGKVKIVLLEGKAETVLKEESITIPGSADKSMTHTAVLPEKAVKFGIKVYIYNAAGTLVRVSHDLAITNPWVAF